MVISIRNYYIGTHATVECHQDIFKSESFKVAKLSFRLSLRATNSLATATRQSLSVLFVAVQYCQITKPCLCVKWQIWVTKVKKKKLNHPKKRPTPCAAPVMHLRLTFVAFHCVLILRFPINCTINCCMDCLSLQSAFCYSKKRITSNSRVFCRGGHGSKH